MPPDPSRPTFSRRDFFRRSLRRKAATTPIESRPHPTGPRPSSPVQGPLTVCPTNPRYFALPSGRAILLTGAPANQAPLNIVSPNFESDLRSMASVHPSLLRLTLPESNPPPIGVDAQDAQVQADLHPWLRNTSDPALDGFPRFDLSQHNPAFFQRLRTSVEQAGRLGIYVSVRLFEPWTGTPHPSAWPRHPFHPANNVNELGGERHSEHRTLHLRTLAHPKVTELQETYLRRSLQEFNGLDNVLYEIPVPQAQESLDWLLHMLGQIRHCEGGLPNHHPVGITEVDPTRDWPRLVDSPADWIGLTPMNTFPDVTADGRKVLLCETSPLGTPSDRLAGAWIAFLRGLNPIFLPALGPTDPFSLQAEDDAPAYRNLDSIRRLSSRLPLTALVPRPDLASSGHCLAGRQDDQVHLLAWRPSGSEQLRLDLSDFPQSLTLSWLDVASGYTHPGDEVQGGSADTAIECPFLQDVLLLAESHPG